MKNSSLFNEECLLRNSTPSISKTIWEITVATAAPFNPIFNPEIFVPGILSNINIGSRIIFVIDDIKMERVPWIVSPCADSIAFIQLKATIKGSPINVICK